MLGQKTPQVYGGAMSIIKINRQDTQHFRDKSTLFMYPFFGFSLSSLTHALPLPFSRGCCDGVLGSTHQDSECCSKTRDSPSQACPSCSHNTAKQPRHALSPKAMLCQMSGGRFAAHKVTISQVVFTREGRGE